MKKLAIMISCIATILVGCNNNTTSEESTEVKRTYNKSINGHEYVDLGLSVKWATCNVGANQPHELGNYFAWGEIRPKDFYGNENSETLEVNVGEDIGGNPSLDAATANWGSTWRMPTKWEALELVNRCTWDIGTLNDIPVMKVTGPNGNYIFLPKAGFAQSGWLKSFGESLYYWCSTSSDKISNHDADFLYLFVAVQSGEVKYKPSVNSGGMYRSLGFPIRPVSN